MKVNALMMDDKDNVVTCVVDIAAGETVVYKKNNEVCTITAKEDIPYCHKIALTDIAEMRKSSNMENLSEEQAKLFLPDTGFHTITCSVYQEITTVK